MTRQRVTANGSNSSPSTLGVTARRGRAARAARSRNRLSASADAFIKSSNEKGPARGPTKSVIQLTGGHFRLRGFSRRSTALVIALAMNWAWLSPGLKDQLDPPE